MAGPLSLRATSTIQVILAQSTFPAESTDFNFDDTYGTFTVHRVLTEPIAVRCTTCGKLHSFKIDPHEWKVEVDENATPSAGEVNSLGSNVKYVHFHGIAITPPQITDIEDHKTQTDDQEHVHTISTKVEIAAVLNNLQKQLGNLQLGYHHWLFASENCRTTTSISSNLETFPLSTAKKVAFIRTAWLRLLDSMCEPQCISAGPLFNDHIGVHLDQWLMKIKKGPGLGSLVVLLRGMKTAGVLDVENASISESSRRSHPMDRMNPKQMLTVEKVSACKSFRFSQQASTLDPKQILAWQDVCEKIVLRAHDAEGTYFAWQFSPEGDFRAPSFGVREMLRELAVKNSTIRFFQKRHTKSSVDLDTQLARALNGVMNVLGPLALYKADATLQAQSAVAVREKVLAKMKAGAYGRMHGSFIQAVKRVQ
ncbi:hypothetical protein CLAFUW4_10588 [Fulvia fulva]|uniref:Uncharacterized protein n=1 Tax=Passalora fulva TaxID=5499 RepID=A0A9Q8P7S0_PASFU|nr:uncharacterized protein CLAFUR5_05202 [Fulvia fulva]KAK4616017.1 hypothetical protein CLAFUR4_10593 [Fulvia fulva]KAK4616751.1 hypothetical protein CLAFUR0_10651 [Fulvia fulva]UJO16409.1 hypothetical protein CLAFUR5_05202 [Fulvia fulva]WPV18905.1 hypothetical protein CLAFUW4_10588 [Fulvia fulva]WPV34629.1 hypothetical protein CLAFUW7_10590 [Fulvia fulva]